jgi:hypothetical protein
MNSVYAAATIGTVISFALVGLLLDSAVGVAVPLRAICIVAHACACAGFALFAFADSQVMDAFAAAATLLAFGCTAVCFVNFRVAASFDAHSRPLVIMAVVFLIEVGLLLAPSFCHLLVLLISFNYFPKYIDYNVAT